MPAAEITFMNGPLDGQRHAVLTNWEGTPPEEVRVPARTAGDISTEYVYAKTSMVTTGDVSGYMFVREVVVGSES